MTSRAPLDDFAGEEVSLGDVIASNELQIRERLDGGAVKRYEGLLRCGGKFKDPITVARITGGEGRLYLVDGFHRVAAAKRACLGRLPATTLPGEITPEEARWLATSANLSHGLPLTTRKERHAAFTAYIAARHYRKERGRGVKTFREIEADLGGCLNFSTIRKFMISDHRSIYDRHYARRNEGGGHPDGLPDSRAFAAKTRERALKEALETVTEVYKRTPSEPERASLKRRLLAHANRLSAGGGRRDSEDDF